MAILDSGALQDRVWNFDGDTYVPDFDLYIWDWAGYSDPGQTLSANITAQIGNTNEPCWSNAEYDELNVAQASEMDRARRKELIDRMQQVMYEQTPWVVLTYPQYLQAYNDAEWTGWQRMFDGSGPGVHDDRLPAVVHRPQAGGERGPERRQRHGLWIATAAVAGAVVVVWAAAAPAAQVRGVVTGVRRAGRCSRLSIGQASPRCG